MNNPNARHGWPIRWRLIVAFQLIILCGAITNIGRGSCRALWRYRQFRRSFPTDGVLISMTITRDNGTMARANVELIDNEGRLVAKMVDAEHVDRPR